MANKFYAVKKGRIVGIFESWEMCEVQIKGFAGAQYQKFKTKAAAQDYLDGKIASSLHQKVSYYHQYQIIAYTDGSFNEEINQFSYGLVFFNKGKKSTFCEKFDDKNWAKLRNVAGEIMGAEKAMQLALANKAESILICHDYAGISKWCTGEWKTTKVETKSYKAFYDKIAKDIIINFKWVKCHSGNVYNDEADMLASKAFNFKKVSKLIS